MNTTIEMTWEFRFNDEWELWLIKFDGQLHAENACSIAKKDTTKNR